ncbi:hypothetical protein ES703_50407 [subsurface metagenome]
MRTIVRVIEWISEWTGRVICWACLALVLVLSFEVIMRYVFDAPTIWSYEIATMLGCTIIILGLAYTHRHHGHVRVDVFWRLLSPRGQAIADVICALLLFFPLVIAIIYISIWWVGFSISIGEIMTKTYWYPPAWPLRIIFFLGFLLFLLQGVSQLVRDLHLAIRNKSYD